MAYVEDVSCSGRPVKVTEDVKNQVIEAILKNLITHQLSTAAIAALVSSLIKGGVSDHTVHCIL